MSYIKKLNLEKLLIEEKKSFASILEIDIDQDILYEENAINSLLQNVQEKDMTVRTLKKNVSNMPEYKKQIIKVCNSAIKEAKQLKAKNLELIKKIDKLIVQHDKKKKEVDGVTYIKNMFLKEKLQLHKSQLRERITTMNEKVETYIKDKSWFPAFNEDNAIKVMNNNIVILEESISQENKIIAEKRERIHALRDLKVDLKTNKQFKFN